MKNFVGIFLIFTAVLLAGCDGKPPDCSSSETINTVREIIVQHYGPRSQVKVEDLASALQVRNARPSNYDKTVRKLTCEATVILPTSEVDEATRKAMLDQPLETAIVYNSQLDESNHHIVTLSGVDSNAMNRLGMLMNYVVVKRRQTETPEENISVLSSTKTATQTNKPERATSKVEQSTTDMKKFNTRPIESGQKELIVLGHPTGVTAVLFDIDPSNNLQEAGTELQSIEARTGGNACGTFFEFVVLRPNQEPLLSETISQCYDGFPEVKKGKDSITILIPEGENKTTKVVATLTGITVNGASLKLKPISAAR
jgi:hypothetical protein